MTFGKNLKDFGHGFAKGMGNVGKGIYKLGRGALGIISNPFTQKLVTAVAPQLAPAAAAAGAVAGGVNRGLDSIERNIRNRDAIGAINSGRDLYNSRDSYKRTLNDGITASKRQRR